MEERKKEIIDIMSEPKYKPLLIEELIVALDIPKEEYFDFRDQINQLENDGKIIKTSKNRYGIPSSMGFVSGRIQGTERGFGFLIPFEEGEDVFIPQESLNGAMHNDKVLIRVNKKGIGERRAEGEVLRIIERANVTIVGIFESSNYFGFVVPDNKRIAGDIFIPKDFINGAKTGQKVVVEVIKWPEKRRNAEGKVVEILGDANDTGTDILSIIKSFGLNENFSEEVLSEIEDIPDVVTKEMKKGRKDLRKLKMVTIDGEDAKDLDDAISIEKIDEDNYRLGVHIADVSYYVKEGSLLDKEARERGTSVYLVDRVIPMLPRKLSNGICSLNPKVDRLAFTVFMEINSYGKVTSSEICESIINIDERMTYTNVYKILMNDEELKEKYSNFVDDFNLMQELSSILKKKRLKRGAVDFDFDEAKIILDDKGIPVEIKKYDYTIANSIIEEFMLCCNETVAEEFYWANIPFVYRIHEDPDIEKIEKFNTFIKSFGYNVKGINKIHPKSFQELLQKVKGKKEEMIVSTVMLRSMQKARYSNTSEGHFGLAAEYYCHFTSPIRRYPDLIIHRLMKEAINKKITAKREEELVNLLPDLAKHCSTKERAAEEAERETKDLKKVEYMKQYLNQEFEGIISSVTSFGMFIQLPNTIEGLIRLASIEDDYYIFDEKNYCLVGEHTKKIYRIGETIKVILGKADLLSRQLEFVLKEDFEEFKKHTKNISRSKSNFKDKKEIKVKKDTKDMKDKKGKIKTKKFVEKKTKKKKK